MTLNDVKDAYYSSMAKSSFEISEGRKEEEKEKRIPVNLN